MKNAALLTLVIKNTHLTNVEVSGTKEKYQAARKLWFNISQGDTEKVSTFRKRVEATFSTFRECAINDKKEEALPDEEDQVSTILDAFNNKCVGYVYNVKSGRDKLPKSVKDLFDALVDHQKLKSPYQPYVQKSTRQGIFAFNANESNKDSFKSKLRCFNCNKFGHFASECKEPPKKKSGDDSKSSDEKKGEKSKKNPNQSSSVKN
jgi:hypothetical protein